LSIAARWIVPMSARDEVLDHHTLVVRDGRILDVLPTAVAALRYAATVHVDRSDHVLLPGLVNAYTRLAPPDAAARGRASRDQPLLAIAEMLQAGTTCFFCTGSFPEESARLAAQHDVRTLIGIPIDDRAFTDGLQLRDEYLGHPRISTAFAPQSAALSDAALVKIATLADELDAGIVLPLHETSAEIAESLERHGVRPLQRLQTLGLLTPSLTALTMVQVDASDLDIAGRSGIAVVLCPHANLRSGWGSAPAAAWRHSGLRLGLGSGADSPTGSMDLWSELRLLALLPAGAHAAAGAWDALAAATRGSAAALGLEAQIGTLETGKWGDVCCVDLGHPSTQRALRAVVSPAADTTPAQQLLTALVFNGGRDQVSDVWIAGRRLLNGGALTRLDWSDALNARAAN
jgi:5-methylthioadenosine/S-adenosylhomocysteine deaminase